MSDTQAVFAVAAHPDDIEFMMAGTLLRLRDRGWAVHYMNIANGSCGTATDPVDVIVAKRRQEALAACKLVGARFYDPICNDLEVFHTNELVGQVVAVIRRIRPRIVLAPSPQDYMEEHMNAARVAATAAFCRGMRNYPCNPHVDPIADDVTLYHALPYGLRGPFRERISPGLYVDVAAVMPEKREMLACHRSQKEWLDKSQGLDAYLDTMEQFSRAVGRMSGRFEFAEGWRRRSHLGYSEKDDDPLAEALDDLCLVDEEYEKALDA